ncbi:MAG: aspartate/glutamate racemase family protein [Anaerolineae bacterium]|nr:aspartate/glutamate racemase family protein [Anaerolineae bacterium]
MATLAIIHTTPATVEPLKRLATSMIPGITVFNWVDDSILPQLAANGGDVSAVAGRIIQYARFAEEAGADVILEACSSVGEVVAAAQQAVAVPIVRIDEAMAEKAVARGKRIGVAATLATTLQPTMRLLQEEAAAGGKAVELEPVLVSEAYQKLMAGDAAGHDAALVAALGELAATVDVVVLAQASMARVVPQLPAGEREKFLSSPQLGMEQVRAVLARRFPVENP